MNRTRLIYVALLCALALCACNVGNAPAAAGSQHTMDAQGIERAVSDAPPREAAPLQKH